MKTHQLFFLTLACICLPLVANADTLSNQLKRTLNQVVSENTNLPKYYVPLIQLNEDEPAVGSDGAEAGIFWVEIGGTTTADGYEPEFFYLLDESEEIEGKDGPSGPFYEEINPKIFNEAYRRFASDPSSAKATFAQTRKMLTKHYRNIQKEKKK